MQKGNKYWNNAPPTTIFGLQHTEVLYIENPTRKKIKQAMQVDKKLKDDAHLRENA